MTAPTETSATAAPRVVLIVSNGPLCIGDPELFGGQPCSHATIKMPQLPLPALAMTAATGVNPLVHGIVTGTQLDPETLQPRPLRSSDRRFPAFWTDAAAAGLRTLAIDWPASDDDPGLPDAVTPHTLNAAINAADVSHHADLAQLLDSTASSDTERLATMYLARLDIVLAAAEAAASESTPPDAMAIVLREPPPSIPPERIAQYVHDRLCPLLTALPAETTVIMVRRWLSGDETTRVFPSAMTLLGGARKASSVSTGISLLAIGGATRLLCGLPCPHGIVQPRWPFLTLPPQDSHRPFATGATSSNMDIAQLVRRVLEMSDGPARTQAIAVLLKEISVLATIGSTSQRFDELAILARGMVDLRGSPVDYWSLVESLHRCGDKEGCDAAVHAMQAAHPSHPATLLAIAMSTIEKAPQQAKQMLGTVDVADFQIRSALGTLGRICLRLDLRQQGEAAIRRAIGLGVANPVDCVALSTHLLRDGQADEAFKVLGRNGIPPNNPKWCILRLRILLALGKTDRARRLADAILVDSPANGEVISLMRGVSGST